MELIGKIVKLRALELEDMHFLQEMINSPGIASMTIGENFPVSYHKQVEWFQNRNEQTDLRYMIQIIGGETIGMISLGDIDWKNRNAEISTKIGAASGRKNGDVFEALMLMLHYCFCELNLHIIKSKVLEYNHLSIKLTKKCGFKEEGVLRERVYKKGNYQNIVSFSMKEEEFIDVYTHYLNNAQ